MESSFTRDMTVQFIELYRRHECLWKKSSRCDAEASETERAALGELVELCARVDPLADAAFVRRQIRALHASCAPKRRRHRSKPKPWYYDMLAFLREEEEQIGAPLLVTVKCEADCDAPSDDGLEADSLSLTYPPVKKPKQSPTAAHYNNMTLGLSPQQNNLNSEFQAITDNIVCKVKRMDPTQAVYAEMLITKILGKGLLNQLTEDMDVID